MTVALDDWIRRQWPHGRPPWHISVFEEMYADEQRRIAQARAERAESKELAELRRRVAAIEKLLGPGGRKLIDPICESVGEFVPRYFDEQMERRKVMRERGVWSDNKTYAPGDFVTFRGAGWVSQLESKGLRPGDGGAWRLAIKSAEPARKS